MSFVYEGRREPLFAERVGRPLDTRVGEAVARMIAWYRQHRTAQALKELDDRLLADIGVARSRIREVAARPYRT